MLLREICLIITHTSFLLLAFCVSVLEKLKTSRVTGYPEFEGIHKGHRVQLLGLHRTTQKSEHILSTILYCYFNTVFS